ncbi:MAG: hypothetical protein ACQEP1_02800 [Nanobdellota archaeon]
MAQELAPFNRGGVERYIDWYLDRNKKFELVDGISRNFGVKYDDVLEYVWERYVERAKSESDNGALKNSFRDAFNKYQRGFRLSDPKAFKAFLQENKHEASLQAVFYGKDKDFIDDVLAGLYMNKNEEKKLELTDKMLDLYNQYRSRGDFMARKNALVELIDYVSSDTDSNSGYPVSGNPV